MREGTSHSEHVERKKAGSARHVSSGQVRAGRHTAGRPRDHPAKGPR